MLVPGGWLFVKCKDEIEAGRNRWSADELKRLASDHGFTMRDMFILVPRSRTPAGRWARQVHARKVHSYLLIFRRNS